MDPSRDLNNKIILLRKSLKSIVNQTKLNLARKVKKGKELKKNIERKESELECFKRVKPSEIPLALGLHPDRLHKIITSKTSIEIDRVNARILQNPLVQKTLIDLKEKYGVERVETFLDSNGKNIKKAELKRLNGQSASVKKKKNKDPESSESESEGESVREDSEGEAVAAISKEKKTESKASKEGKKKPQKEPREEKPKHSESQKTLDPFFVSSSGEGYFAAITNALSDDESAAGMEKKHTKKPIKKNAPIKRPPLPAAHPAKRQRNDVISKTPTAPAPISEPNAEQELHPSWKAKQQMKKLQIQEFKGTKIKFDD